MYLVKNQTTQPVQEFPIFNNWNEVALGWYYLFPSHELKSGSVKSFQVCGQELVIFRSENGELGALDAYCPHMGTHLGKGKVVKNNVRCFFHHWEFTKEGVCAKIPCQTEIPEKIKVPNYQICEKYEAIWIYPQSSVTNALANFEEFSSDDKLVVRFGKSYERSCHHHVTMINGIDPQHLKTVHNLDIEMKIDIAEPSLGSLMDITLKGKIGSGRLAEKIARFFLGDHYSYSMRYDHGNNGLLTLMKDVSFLGHKWPSLHMIFAYRPVEKGRMEVHPIYLTKKRSGPGGFIISHFLLWMTKRAFFSLQGEDGAVYENMRFNPLNLLSIDRPVGQYIQYVNKLKPSNWKLA
ncbi:MAG: Rieske 2Fe-2S domain-containing protein [Bdellovibrionales bacterium]|nr:Rieske 2Fe-2S domain-containing protein [Bdellovibrionales bacterium]